MALGRLASLLLVAGACTFPEITVVLEDGGGGTGGTGAVSTSGVTTAATTSTTSSSSTASSASAGGGGAGGGCVDLDEDGEDSVLCGGTDCDDDGDDVPVDSGDCCPSGPCDCYDGDDRVKPGQMAFFTEAWDGADDYDYDCSSFEEPRYTTTCPQQGVLSCGEGKAYASSTPCGQTGQAQGCTGILGSCSKSGAPYSLQQECH